MINRASIKTPKTKRGSGRYQNYRLRREDSLVQLAQGWRRKPTDGPPVTIAHEPHDRRSLFGPQDDKTLRTCPRAPGLPQIIISPKRNLHDYDQLPDLHPLGAGGIGIVPERPPTRNLGKIFAAGEADGSFSPPVFISEVLRPRTPPGGVIDESAVSWKSPEPTPAKTGGIQAHSGI